METQRDPASALPTPPLPRPQDAPLAFESRVATLSYAGGLIGAMTGGLQRRKLETTIARYNEEGYRLAHVLPAKTGILFHLIGLVCLLITLFLWAPQPGETLIFERRSMEKPGPAGRDIDLAASRLGLPPTKGEPVKVALVVAGIVAIPVVLELAWRLGG
ncbi:MAG: hypothetical protein WC654_00085 [Patescibacteria group bacterium]